MRTRASSVELLESRIAPAAVSIVYTDADGDLVKITASKPGAVPPALGLSDLTFIGDQLATVNVTHPVFDGASIVFTVTKKPGGDGLAHVGFINASGVDLDRVVVKGDLGRIAVGDAVMTDPGLNLLQARTMGTLGLLSQGGVGDLVSTVAGSLGALKVSGDFTDAALYVVSPVEGGISSIVIGGDLAGGANDYTGWITTSGNIGRLRIGGNLTGGAGENSGAISSAGAMSSVRIGGDLIGGAGESSGRISSGALSDVRIGGSLIGGAGSQSGRVSSLALGDVRIGGDVIGVASGSGYVRSFSTMGTVRIGGDLVGGTNSFSGYITSVGAMGAVRIGGDLLGGGTTGDSTLFDSGTIRAGRIASVTLGGSLIAGTDAGAGQLIRCGAIVADDDLGPVKIGGSILGNSTNPALIIARGQDAKPASGFDTAIASLTVGGDVRFADILAGFDFNQSPVNADAAIGAVKVGHDWVASNLVAGAQDAGLPGWGVGDTLQAAGDTALIARIAGITIKGDVAGSYPIGDTFGFVAEQIDKLRIGGRAFALTPGPGSAADNFLIFPTSEVRLLEVS